MTNWWNVLFLMALLIAGLGCGNREGDLHGYSSEPLVRFQPFDYSRQLPSCAEDTLRCVRLLVSVPRATGQNDSVTGRINDTLSAYLRQALSVFGLNDTGIPQTAQLAADQLFEEYGEMQALQPGYAMPWWVEVAGELVWRNDHVACLRLLHQSYTGGAHANRTVSFYNFDLATGLPLPLEDLLLDPGRLREIAERRFREVHGIKAGRSLQEAGFFWGRAFKLPENYALRAEGLQLYYNSYEVASYVQGPTSFVIPYDELEGVLILSKIK